MLAPLPYDHPYSPAPGYSVYSKFAGSLGYLGDTGDPTTIAAIAAQGAATTGGILAGLSAMGALSPMFALAGPIGAAIAGLTAVGIAIANQFQGCGQTCVLASQDANQVQAYLEQNAQHYFNSPVHYRSLQLAAANNVNTALAALRKACSDPQLGDAGVRCISERLVQGGSAPWCPNPGGIGCDWVTAYLLPIQNDPNVVPDPSTQTGTGSGVNAQGLVITASPASSAGFFSGAGGNNAPSSLLIAAGAALVLAMVLGGGN